MKSAPSADIVKMAENIAYHSVRYVAKLESNSTNGINDDALKQTLERMLDTMTTQNSGFTQLLMQLQLNEENCSRSLSSVFAEMLADQMPNWGRILTVYCFSGCAAKYLLDRGCSDKVAYQIAKTCADFISQDLAVWIEQQGGWEQFRSYFREQEKAEPVTWRGWHDLVRKGISAVSSAVSVR